jgi:hypothetical protein
VTLQHDQSCQTAHPVEVLQTAGLLFHVTTWENLSAGIGELNQMHLEV